MEFDDAKENIQPLVQGRNASILHASLNVESPQELLAQRVDYEEKIHKYSGNDPLCVWYNYIEWIEQSFPSGGKESGLQEVLFKCLAQFESEERYKQDRRMVKLYIKFIDSQANPAEFYQQLFNAGIGTMIADFYIAWAYCYDLVGNTRMADEIFVRGIACRAQPLEELQEARQHFGFSVAQRLMYKDNDPIREETNRQLQERRMALTSLRGHRRKQLVGSIRTGSALKSELPGTVEIDLPSTSSQLGNARVQVFKDENKKPNVMLTPSNDSTSVAEVGKSVVRSIIDAARNQENQKEPGPWNKAHSRKKGKLFGTSTSTSGLDFEILEDTSENIKNTRMPPITIADSEIKFDKPFIYPPNFCVCSKPIKGWNTPVTTEEAPDVNTIFDYNKCKLYPRPNMEFQPEELKAYNFLKKRGIRNDFVNEREVYWGCGPKYNIRLYPHFAKKSKPQALDSMDQFFSPEQIPGLKFNIDEIYKKEQKIERQFEEIWALRIKRNETIIETTDMEETMCTTSGKVQRRKSFFPLRKSVAHSTFTNKMNKVEDENLTTLRQLPSSSSINLVNAKAVEEFEAKKGELHKNNDEKGTAVSLRLPTAPQEASALINYDKSPKLIIKKTCEGDLHSEIVNDTVSDMASLQPFKIFEDTRSPYVNCIKDVPKRNDFNFKTPALPITNSTSVSSMANKIPFTIFDDENLTHKSSDPKSNTNFDCDNGGFFDPEESCSTQTFNIFLKAQSVSTPKAVIKSKPQKHFGNILKEIPPPTILEEKDDPSDNENLNVENQNNIPEDQPIITYSPPRQQLSTILETSEHGSTQGTHTTGATTKSTLSSPEWDIDAQSQTPRVTYTNQPQTILETVQELSCESSMNNIMADNMNSNSSRKNNEIPVGRRFENKSGSDGLNYSIFEESVKKDQRQVGNFSRLEEKEDTAVSSVFKTIPSIRFQDDKTDTISKIFLTSQQKFQDDKTETISKIMFEPLTPKKFQGDRSEIISTMLPVPTQPNFPEDKTEKISKSILVKLDDEKAQLENTQKEKQLNDTSHKDDSFEFFGQTPPKAAKPLFTKKVEPGSHFNIRSATNNLSLLTFGPKYTHEAQKTKLDSNPTILMEEELLQPYLKNGKNSPLSKFSFIEESQPVLPLTIAKPKSKSVFRDSFIPDFSVLEDSSKPTSNLVQSGNEDQKTNKSNLPEFSLIKNVEPKLSKPEQDSTLNLSLLSEFSHIAETRNNESIKSSTKSGNLKQSFGHGSILKKYPKGAIQENKNDEKITWKQSQSVSSVLPKTQDGPILKNILMDTFVKDFSEINEPPPMPSNINQISMLKPIKNNSTLRFLSESLDKKSYQPKNMLLNSSNNNLSYSKEPQLNFLPATGSLEKENYFELNCETEMFGRNVGMIKNSTWLPDHGPWFEQLPQIAEKSLHIKSEQVSTTSLTFSEAQNEMFRSEEPAKLKHSIDEKSLCNNNCSIEIPTSEFASFRDKISHKHIDNPIIISESPEHNNDDKDMSIYYKQTPKTPKNKIHTWDDAEATETNAQNEYVHAQIDLNQTHQIIENIVIDPNVNPFNVELIHAFLEQHYVVSYLETLPSCKLVGSIQRLKQNSTIEIDGIIFNVIKLIGEGAYGAVFCGKEASTGKLVAMKQEKPPNFWEYYICLEVRERIQTDEMLQSYMMVDYALIGNNSSILISDFSQYGSLITVCNKIKKHTMKNVDEYVVMLLASELLEIMDHLHAINIIHADIKADNFVLMKTLTFPPTQRHLQLIDFGVSIDMKLFKEGQTFSFVHNDNSIKCPEMRERRPWTYQLDLYGLASVIHVLLFGKYMDIEKKDRGFWMHTTHVPRYLNRNLWDELFKTLLNVRDCKSMPNLQALRALLKKEMEEKDKYVLRMVNDFNRALYIYK